MLFLALLPACHVSTYSGGCEQNCNTPLRSHKTSQVIYLRGSGGLEIHVTSYSEPFDINGSEVIDCDAVFRDFVDPSTYTLYVGCGGCMTHDPHRGEPRGHHGLPDRGLGALYADGPPFRLMKKKQNSILFLRVSIAIFADTQMTFQRMRVINTFSTRVAQEQNALSVARTRPAGFGHPERHGNTKLGADAPMHIDVWQEQLLPLPTPFHRLDIPSAVESLKNSPGRSRKYRRLAALHIVHTQESQNRIHNKWSVGLYSACAPSLNRCKAKRPLASCIIFGLRQQKKTCAGAVDAHVGWEGAHALARSTLSTVNSRDGVAG